MDRQIVYAGQIPLETDLLNTNKNTMVAIGKLAAAMFGTGTFINGLAVTPNSPAALNVLVGPGEIYSLQQIDATAYSSIAADTADYILKQGITLATAVLSCPAPATAGQSINYLVQAAFAETDTGLTLLPYYNSSNPSVAWSGPNNTGTSQNTSRSDQCVVTVKAGTAAATGSQTTPAPDANNVGIAVVTVANGQATITSANIVQYSGAAFVPAGGATRAVTSALLPKNVAGNSNITLDPNGEAPYPIIVLSGALTGNINVIVPSATDQWIFVNNTTGNYTVNIKTASGTGIIVPQGYVFPLFCDGTNVQSAITGAETMGDVRYASSQFNFGAAVASNALTGTLQGGCKIDFRNTSLTSGVPINFDLGNALSCVVPSGATLGTVNAVSARLVWLVAYNAGAPVLCVVNLAGSVNLDETTLISPTTISGGATSANVIYSASAVAANSPFRVVGFCDITEATAGTWATAPTTVQGAGGLALAGLASAGNGQTITVTGRSISSVGVTFYNPTPRQMFVNIGYLTGAGTGSTLWAIVNGVSYYFGAGGNGVDGAISFPVPAFGNYSVINPSIAISSILGWTETK